jgi:hypothetical protein
MRRWLTRSRAMQHGKYPFALLALLGCSSSPSTAEEDLTRERLHGHMHKVLFDSGTTPNDAGSPQQDSGVQQQQDSGVQQQQQQDSGVQQQQDSGVQQQQDAGNNFIPAGWLYTSGNHVYVSNGTIGTVWIGRGVNADDTYLCGYNGSQWMSNSEQALTSMMSNVSSNWNAKFVRISLSMYSFPQTPASWIGTSTYKTAMTNVIDSLTNAGVYVLVTVRSDSTMQEANNDEATGLPTSSTDPTYVALVDTFANNKYVLFGLSNEPGGNAFSSSTIRSAMDHATTVIRNEENKLGVPHHIVSVQGNSWTSDISFYGTSPLSQDNVVYEVHGYPPMTTSYTYSNIPVIIGEYGSLPSPSTFFADLESKQIPSLAWDFEPYSNCAPDLVTVNLDPTNTVDTTWGTTVQQYLLAH